MYALYPSPMAGMTNRRTLRRPRAGVTLVELMVSLAVLAILSGLFLTGLATARASARASKTTSTIRKISEIILPYYELYETRRPQLPPSISTMPRSEAAELKRIALRRLMTLELPERPRDVTDAFQPGFAFNPTTRTVTNLQVQPLAVQRQSPNTGSVSLSEMPPVARRYLSIMAPLLQATGPGAITSADMLHMIVMRGPAADPDVLMHFRSDEIADTNGNGMLEFVDGWQRPIYFKRWPVGFKSPAQPIDGRPEGIDEDVSLGGHRLVPLIFSAGPDGEADIEAMGDFSYFQNYYQPFATAARIVATPSILSGTVVLRPVRLSPNDSETYFASRVGEAVTFPPGTVQNDLFTTVGSEADTNDNKILESRDNIHNHDLAR
jgi:prepilin-type N-terminal cleavage/methylation domain-containing protein